MTKAQSLFPSQLVRLGKNLSKAVTKFHKFTNIHSLDCSLGSGHSYFLAGICVGTYDKQCLSNVHYQSTFMDSMDHSFIQYTAVIQRLIAKALPWIPWLTLSFHSQYSSCSLAGILTSKTQELRPRRQPCRD